MTYPPASILLRCTIKSQYINQYIAFTQVLAAGSVRAPEAVVFC